MTPDSEIEDTPEVTGVRPDTTLVLAICALLIVNSHLETFYPTGLQFLAADGLLGNSLFFMLSGFGIQTSLMNWRQTFGSFMQRQIMRIYPALFIVVAPFKARITSASHPRGSMRLTPTAWLHS